MSESETPYRLNDDPFVLSVEAIEDMRTLSESEAVRPPSGEEQADLILGFLSRRRKS
ncbi:MAG: hypothetical protein WC880_01785 [Candidatus Paceibacterota bacterium]